MSKPDFAARQAQWDARQLKRNKKAKVKRPDTYGGSWEGLDDFIKSTIPPWFIEYATADLMAWLNDNMGGSSNLNTDHPKNEDDKKTRL